MGEMERVLTIFRLGKWSAEHLLMPGIVEFPQVVQDAVAQYGDLFANECQRRHFAEYLTGLMVAERKTVLGNQPRVRPDHRSVLPQPVPHRGRVGRPEPSTNDDWSELQKDPSTRYSDQGVIPIDNTLIDRDGLLIPDAGWFWDHAEERNKIAQDYLFVNYVCTSGKHYPLEFRLFRKQEICEALKEPFRNHTVLCCELIDWVCERKIPGDFAMDCYFTSAEILNHIHGKQDRFGRPRGYVGDLKSNRKLEWKGQIIKANDLAASIPPRIARRCGSGQTAVVLHGDGADPRREAQGADRDPLAVSGTMTEPCKILVTNRITWEVSRIVRVYRHRWTGTETFHRDGKQQLGMGDCQLRDAQGQTRHMYLVMLAYSLLDEPIAAGPCEGMGAPSADDHRRSLSGDAPGDPAHDAGLGDRAGHREGAAV